MPSVSRTQNLLLILFLVVVWGVNWPLSKMALAYTPPILFSGLRTLLGGLLLLFAALPRLKGLHFRKNWSIYLTSALLNVVLYYGLQTIGLNHLPAGLFSAIVFLQPVLVGIFSWIWLGESMYALKLLGLILGFSGVGLISAGGMSGHISVTGVLLALGSALSWALGTVYVKRIGSRVDPIWLVSLQLISGGLFMTLLGSRMEHWSDIDWAPAFIAELSFISCFVIAIGWLVFYKLMDTGEAGRVASYTFLIPLVAILIGTIFLQEPLTLPLLLGLMLIVISIYLVNRKPRYEAVRVKKSTPG